MDDEWKEKARLTSRYGCLSVACQKDGRSLQRIRELKRHASYSFIVVAQMRERGAEWEDVQKPAKKLISFEKTLRRVGQD